MTASWGFRNILNAVSFRIWTGGAAPSSNPMSFLFITLPISLIHTPQNFFFTKICCTLSEPDPTRGPFRPTGTRIFGRGRWTASALSLGVMPLLPVGVHTHAHYRLMAYCRARRASRTNISRLLHIATFTCFACALLHRLTHSPGTHISHALDTRNSVTVTVLEAACSPMVRP